MPDKSLYCLQNWPVESSIQTDDHCVTLIFEVYFLLFHATDILCNDESLTWQITSYLNRNVHWVVAIFHQFKLHSRQKYFVRFDLIILLYFFLALICVLFISLKTFRGLILWALLSATLQKARQNLERCLQISAKDFARISLSHNSKKTEFIYFFWKTLEA